MRSTFKVLFYLKRNKKKTQSAVPLMGRITVNGTISQFSAKLTVPERLWEVRGGRAKGRSLEADRINRHQDDNRSQLDRHYRDIRDRESYVTAEKVKNAWLGFGKRYRTLLSTFRSFTDDLHGRIGVDRSKNTWYRYLATMKHLQAFLTVIYRVSDIALAELEQSFIEQFHVYLRTECNYRFPSAPRPARNFTSIWERLRSVKITTLSDRTLGAELGRLSESSWNATDSSIPSIPGMSR